MGFYLWDEIQRQWCAQIKHFVSKSSPTIHDQHKAASKRTRWLNIKNAFRILFSWDSFAGASLKHFMGYPLKYESCTDLCCKIRVFVFLVKDSTGSLQIWSDELQMVSWPIDPPPIAHTREAPYYILIFQSNDICFIAWNKHKDKTKS